MSKPNTQQSGPNEHGQCIAIREATGERCPYDADVFCGQHLRAENPTLAPDVDEKDWFRCPECGWQLGVYACAGSAPTCAECGVEFPASASEWDETTADSEGAGDGE